MQNVQLVSRGENYADFSVRAVVYEKPDAWFSKGGADSEIRVEVCGNCGFIRPYAADPKRLWVAYKSKFSDVQ